MPPIKTLVKRISQVNREYVLLFFIVILLGFLIYTSAGRTQAPPEEITLTTYYPSPFGEFNKLICSLMYDYDDISYYCDPNGLSVFHTLTVQQGITTSAIGGTGIYTINFNSGNARLNNVVADNQLIMGSSGPISQRAGGKYVYDISEGISANGCKPGDVVVIDRQGKDWGLIRSSRKFDTSVAGVVSTDPKIFMGPGKKKLPLALAGIVPCNVTAENGPVKRGDLLVTSSQPGYAMRSDVKDVKPGMLVGKALQGLKKGKGRIYILVNKQ